MSLPLLGAGPTAPTASGPATEDIRPNSTSSFYETLVGASAHVALSDNSDVTRVAGDLFFASWVGGFGDLTLAAGRAVASFVVIVRCDILTPETQTSTVIPTVTGATVAGSGNFNTPATVGNATAGPFTRSGGGNFTEAMLNSLTADIGIDSGEGSPRLYEVTVRVTYA
jgi:hypothetical protein